MQLRRPVYLKRMGVPGAEAFAVLFALESLSRALLATVLPLEALRLLGDASGVSMLFFCVSLGALFASLLVPWLVARTARRWVYAGGMVGLGLAPLLMLGASLEGLALGMLLRAVGVVAMAVCLNLYILDFIAKKDMNRSEPLRLFYSAAAWCAGPFLGVWLAEAFGRPTPFLLAGATAFATLAYFCFLRITDNPAVVQRAGPTPSPLVYLPRFFAQPRLTLAWLLSAGRNIWWVVFFIYTPIYAVESGLGETVGAAIVSCGTGFLFLMPFFGGLVRRHGLRRVFVVGFGLAAVLTLALLPVWELPWIAAACLICAALGMISIDAGGNLLFLFAVRRHERAEMTTVYSTYRDLADVAPPGILSVLLRFFDLSVVFLLAGLGAMGLAALSARIHPRLGRERVPTPPAVAPGLAPEAAES